MSDGQFAWSGKVVNFSHPSTSLLPCNHQKQKCLRTVLAGPDKLPYAGEAAQKEGLVHDRGMEELLVEARFYRQECPAYRTKVRGTARDPCKEEMGANEHTREHPPDEREHHQHAQNIFSRQSPLEDADKCGEGGHSQAPLSMPSIKHHVPSHQTSHQRGDGAAPPSAVPVMFAVLLWPTPHPVR